jgi:hypothetical protein
MPQSLRKEGRVIKMKGTELKQSRNKRGSFLWMVMAAYLALTGCASYGPMVLNKAVIHYDDSVLQSEQQLLLINIIRMHDDQPPHFTIASSIAATFELAHSTGLTSSFSSNSATNIYTYGTGISLGTTVSDKPTITIAPMQGKDVAQRLLKPIDTTFVNTILLQQSGRKLLQMIRLMGKDFLMIGPENAKKAFEGIPLPLKVKDSQGKLVKIKYKYPMYSVKDLQDKGGFTKEQAGCLLDEDGCYLVNSPPRIPLEDTIKRVDINNYELFRKVALHLRAMALSGRLQVFILCFDLPAEGIEGTFRAAKTLEAKDIKDTLDAFEKQYRWKKVTEGKGFRLTKRYPFTALTDFDYAKMEEKDKKALLKRIQGDLGLDEAIKFDEGMIIVLLRGDDKNQWPIYGLFTLRNFRQTLQFLAESLKDQRGYGREYDVAPSQFTTELLEKEKLQPRCLDNPPLTLAITSRMIPTIPPRDGVVDVDYKGELFWVSSSPGQTGAPPQPPERKWDNPHPPRWDKEVFSMLYEIFQFNRIEPAVSPPSISISK